MAVTPQSGPWGELNLEKKTKSENLM